MTPHALNRMRFSGGDFATHFNLILERLQAEYRDEFDDFAVNGLGVALIDLVASALDGLSFQIDNRASNLYLATATVRRLVHLLCRQVGYKPPAAVASSVELSLSVLDTLATTIALPAGTRCRGPGELIYEFASEVVVTVPESGGAAVKTVSAYEGESFSTTFTSDGQPNQRFALRRVVEPRYVAQGSVRVTVDGEPYAEAEVLRFGATRAFECDYADDPPRLRFGDGSMGSIPPSGSSIVVTYLVTHGRSGLVSYDSITQLDTPLVVGGVPIRVSINNPRGSVGGDDPESLASAASNASAVFHSGGLALTAPDYVGLAGRFADPVAGRVAVAQALLVRSTDDDVVLASERAAILGAFNSGVAAVTTDLADARADLAVIGSALASMATLNTALASTAATLTGELEGVLSTERAIRGQAQNLAVSVTAASTSASTARASIAGIATGGSDTLTTVTRTALLLALDTLLATLSTAAASSATATASAEANVAAIQAILAGLSEDVGTDDTASADGAPVQRVAALIEDAQTSVGTSSTGALGALAGIELAVISTAGASRTALTASLDTLTGYVDSILADEAKSNVVQVPILAFDGGGFYVAPSVALVQALQAHLDARCGATQVPVVVSGAGRLIRPSIAVRVRAVRSLSAVMQLAALAAINALLRARPFGASLYRSDVDRAVRAIAGVLTIDVSIQGHFEATPLGDVLVTTLLDEHGNLIIQRSQTITSGVVTAAVELVDDRAP